ncbi:MAG: calcium-translocating P-type ATPase, PMCA-type [Sedimentibacter sp.]
MKNLNKNYIGLSKENVLISREKYGANIIEAGKRKTFLNHYMASFGDPTIKILLVALGLNVLFFIKNFNWYESIGIAVSIILATFVSSISEYGSQLAFEKLVEDAQKTKCRVWRDGIIVEIFVSEVVKGDFVQLEQGDRIPADGLLIDGQIDVDQSSLNGETKEAHKISAAIINYDDSNDNSLSNPNLVFSSSIVYQGTSTMLVQSVGEKTYYGHLAKELQQDKSDSPLKQRLTELARSISRLGYIGAVLILISSLFKSIIMDNGYNISNIEAYFSNPYIFLGDFIRAITLAVTIIVVAVPEGLPVMITVVLSSNMKRMIKDNVLVRKLVGIETAGSLNILFTDKTGTLTVGKLQVSKFITGEGNIYDNIHNLKEQKNLWKIIYISSIYNNSSKLGYNGRKQMPVGGNSTDRAMLNFALSYPLIRANITKTAQMPFNSINKYSASTVEGDLNLTLIKGAPEKIIPYCKYFYDESGAKLEISNIFYINKIVKDMAATGIRVLALATSDKSIDSISNGFSSLTLVGIACIKDELRHDVYESLEKVTSSGVQVVMITGDGKETATAIAKESNLLDTSKGHIILTSEELNRLTDAQVKKLMPNLRAVARALPSDKSRLIKLSQEMNLVAGMTGDGVNDAPALKRADVGFSMGSGTEVAKEASDIVILDDNFSSISKSILYGRTIFKSIRKFIIFQLSINVCAMAVTLIGLFIGIETPITVTQMLWINMVMDTLAGLAFAGETPLPEYMEEMPKEKGEKIINGYMENQIFATSIYTTALCVLFLKLPNISNLFRYSSSNDYLMTGFFALFMLCAIFNSLNARTQRLNLLSNLLKNKAFVAIMGIVCIIQILILYFGGSVFRTYGLTLKELLTVLSLSFTVIPFDLMRKSFLRLSHTKEEVAKFL